MNQPSSIDKKTQELINNPLTPKSLCRMIKSATDEQKEMMEQIMVMFSPDPKSKNAHTQMLFSSDISKIHVLIEICMDRVLNSLNHGVDREEAHNRAEKYMKQLVLLTRAKSEVLLNMKKHGYVGKPSLHVHINASGKSYRELKEDSVIISNEELD